MRPKRALCAMLVLAACGSPPPPDSFATTDTRLYDSTAIETRRAFEEAIVGHSLRGEGVDVVVAPGGVLIGQHYGNPISGAWVFRRGEFCYALDDRVRRSSRRCYRVALVGRTVHLVPADP